MKLRNSVGQKYFRVYLDLENKKEKLFNSSDILKWEVDFNSINLSRDDIVKSKKASKVLMLPEVRVILSKQTRRIKEMQKIFGYLNSQMLEQSEYLGLKRSKRYAIAISEFCSELLDTYSEAAMDIAIHNNHICNLFNEIKEGESKYMLSEELEALKSIIPLKKTSLTPESSEVPTKNSSNNSPEVSTSKEAEVPASEQIEPKENDPVSLKSQQEDDATEPKPGEGNPPEVHENEETKSKIQESENPSEQLSKEV